MPRRYPNHIVLRVRLKGMTGLNSKFFNQHLNSKIMFGFLAALFMTAVHTAPAVAPVIAISWWIFGR